MADREDIPQWAAEAVDLAQPRLGSRVLSSSDDFFAAHDRLIDPTSPVFKPDVYDDNGKWMDGWESRRKRDAGYDHCIIALGRPGQIFGFEIDTSHFTGNYAPAASIEGCIASDDELDDAQWVELLSPQALRGDDRQFFRLAPDERAWTHLRFNIFPDGGVARLRVFGRVVIDWSAISHDDEIDLAALENGGRAIAASDAHFGALANLIAPGKAANMGDGWETRRRRSPGFDWGILKLGHAGRIGRLEIDTAHFKGNYAFETTVYGALIGNLPDPALPAMAIYWPVLLGPVQLTADEIHSFASELQDIGPVDHLRIDLFPDGGISRLRAFGTLEG